MSVESKVIVTVAEMARMVGLSRARFYQLIGTAFPHPVYDLVSKRPHYTEEQQQICLEVRRRNYGIDKKPIMFYARRVPNPVKKVSPELKRQTSKVDPHAELLDAVRSLGLSSATSLQVAEAVKQLYPTGTNGTDHGEVIRTVFVHLKRKDTTGNVRR